MKSKFLILRTEVFDDIVKIDDFKDEKILRGLQVDFTVKVMNKIFNISTQEVERYCSLRNYFLPYEMEISLRSHGNGADQSEDFEEFCFEKNIDDSEVKEFFHYLEVEATKIAKEYYLKLMKEEKKNKKKKKDNYEREYFDFEEQYFVDSFY